MYVWHVKDWQNQWQNLVYYVWHWEMDDPPERPAGLTDSYWIIPGTEED